MMHRTHARIHSWIVGAALLVAISAPVLPKNAHAADGYYTTTTTSTSSSATDPVTGITTTTTNSSTSTPSATLGDHRWRNARNSGSEATWRDRAARDEDADPNHTSDMEARFPYDNTNGRHRSDVDAARTGFDDPRNPWDGRYANDNPSNAVHSNDRVNGLRGNEESLNRGNDRYRPGRYGTRSVRPD